MTAKEYTLKADDLTRLTAVRTRLEGVLKDPETTPRDLASVSREYRLVLDSISSKSGGSKSSPADEIAKRRAKRKGTA